MRQPSCKKNTTDLNDPSLIPGAHMVGGVVLCPSPLQDVIIGLRLLLIHHARANRFASTKTIFSIKVWIEEGPSPSYDCQALWIGNGGNCSAGHYGQLCTEHVGCGRHLWAHSRQSVKLSLGLNKGHALVILPSSRHQPGRSDKDQSHLPAEQLRSRGSTYLSKAPQPAEASRCQQVPAGALPPVQPGNMSLLFLCPRAVV